MGYNQIRIKNLKRRKEVVEQSGFELGFPGNIRGYFLVLYAFNRTLETNLFKVENNLSNVFSTPVMVENSWSTPTIFTDVIA